MASETKREPWVMPDWMEPYREHFQNTGGNSIEDLMNDTTTNGVNNIVRAALIVAVEAQVHMLYGLKRDGLLKEADDDQA